ncbi:DUF6124 family protein [Pseudomonas sp. Marseille-P9899]|uniref:DUF6124 family protein n=1 Tax=Pseudomonas sp. Marseille-P9899 TaxID=2730401 RepID=UPI00158BEF04|nr:hypothetical protein [Pseudomonas sp. Marseille-P9899]
MSAPSLTYLDSEAARRAIDFYLNPEPQPATGVSDMQLVVARHDLSQEDAGEQATWLLRCASSSASDAALRLQGKAREQMLTVMHLVNLARAMVEHSLSQTARNEECEAKAPC